MKWKKLYLLKKEFVTAKHYIKHCQVYSELIPKFFAQKEYQEE